MPVRRKKKGSRRREAVDVAAHALCALAGFPATEWRRFREGITVGCNASAEGVVGALEAAGLLGDDGSGEAKVAKSRRQGMEK